MVTQKSILMLVNNCSVSRALYVVCAFCIVIFISCGKEKKIHRLTFAHNLPISHPVHKGVVAFKDHLEKLSKGQLQLKIYPNGQLGSEREVIELLQIGSVSMTKVSAAAMSNFVPEYKVLGVPYLFRNKEHLFRVLEGPIGEELLKKGIDTWLRGLCFYTAGSRSFYTKDKALERPVDLKGLKIRVMNDQLSVNLIKCLGATPTPMAFGELYTALQQGVVDGAENNIPSFVSSRHFEICKFYSLDEHSYVPDVVVMGTKFYERLTSQERLWVLEAATKSVEDQKRFWEIAEKESMETLMKSGVKLIYPQKRKFNEKTNQIIIDFMADAKMRKLIRSIDNFK
jgi:tripartite ATP-independent transporter DctP family solute receptor